MAPPRDQIAALGESADTGYPSSSQAGPSFAYESLDPSNSLSAYAASRERAVLDTLLGYLTLGQIKSQQEKGTGDDVPKRR